MFTSNKSHYSPERIDLNTFNLTLFFIDYRLTLSSEIGLRVLRSSGEADGWPDGAPGAELPGLGEAAVVVVEGTWGTCR